MAAQQQQDLQQLMDLLTREEEDVVKSFIKSLSGSGAQSHYERLQELLIASPYPMLQILQILYEQSKFHIGRIISAGLKQMLDDDVLNSNIALSRLLSVLANFPQQILEVATMQQKLIERLVSDSWGNNEHIMLALLARQDAQLLNTVLHTQQQKLQILCSIAAPSRQLVLHLALNQREHFVPRLCQQLKNFECILDHTVRNNLLILRLANEFALGTQTLDELAQLDQTLLAFDVASVPAQLQPVQLFFYADFQRLCLLLKFLQKQKDGNAGKTINVDALLRADGVLSLIYEHGIECNSDQIVQLIEHIYKWQQQTPALKCVRAEELATMRYYTALCHVYNVILEVQGTTVREQLLLLSAQLRQVRELGTLCSLLQDIFQLVFLRWEQLQKTKQRDGNDDDAADEDEDDDEQYVDDVNDAMPPRTANLISSTQRERYGFICRAPALYALFSYLKSFVTKKLHTQDFKCASEEQQRCFQRLVDAISQALWKFSVLQKIEQSLKKATPASGCCLEPEQLLQLIQLHSHSREKASSDDESRERSYHASSLTRRKSRRQRRASSFSGAAGNTTADAPTLEQCRARAQQLLISGDVVAAGTGHKEPKLAVAAPTERSIIPKMLSTPEQLAIMALALKNFNDVKCIIETCHLEHSQLSRELQFMEHQQLIKQKLATIYANYEALAGDGNTTASSTTTTVERIKSVAAKGFELSKIISVVDNFAQAQKLQHSAELKVLLQRHSANAQYGFLQQFQERNLNALIVCDLIVNLRFNREITSNLLLVIRRQQQQQQQQQQPLQQTSLDSSSDASSREIGAMYLMQNLCECMRLLERAGRQPALNELLCRNTYALRPAPLALQLQREAAFTTLYQKTSSDYAHFRDLRAHASLFQQLRSQHNYYARFCGYMQQLARLLQLRDPNLEYHNTELLRHDPYQVIGELIYECDITPLEIESNVTALHLNLVHVIALNICPQLAEGTGKKSTRSVTPQKQESIHNYIAQHNQLLAQLLQAVQLGDLPSISASETGLNFACLRQLMQLPEMTTLGQMHDRNQVLAALHAYKLDSTTLEHLELTKELQLHILLLGIGGAGEPVKQLKLRIDRLIIEMIEEDPRHIQLAAHMHNLGARARLLQQHFTKISSSQLAKELIERTLQHREATSAIPLALRAQLENTLSDITIYASVSGLLEFESWPQAYDFGRQTPNVIFEQLLQGRHYELCYKWCRMVQLTDSAGQQRVCLLTLLDTLLELRDDDDELDAHLLYIAELFPSAVLVNFLDTHKDKMRSLPLLQWLVDYLEQHARDPRLYRNYQLSIELLRQLPIGERLHFWPLLRYPLLIVEQLVMNTRFELLSKLLEPARAKLQQRMPLGPCGYCFEKRGHAYDVHSSGTSSGSKLRFQLGQSSSEAFILLNFNSYQQDHVISNDCFDLLLRIYASKALDYQISNVRAASVPEPGSLGTDVQTSLDSLCGAFQMPKEPPTREQWTPDEETTHCMCCRRSAFTMLMRRHHCRRCGRVVCYACSTHRMIIPALYGDVEVRVCNDCCIPAAAEQKLHINEAPTAVPRSSSLPSDAYRWRLSGIITHDKLLREEFCYEHAPSVALTLSILRHHLDQRQCVDLLLFHCRKLEKLIVPNPEVDYELVAKMMNCLALAAKMRGATGEFEAIRNHSEIIMAVVQQGCESLIPAGPLNNHRLRKLADALVEAEHWKLALEVQVKWGFATTGVMAAHGLACLRAGCYDAAREKFAHCMARLSTEELNSCIYKSIFGKDLPVLAMQPVPATIKKRPQRGPALLQEILQLIATMPQANPQPETLQRASLMRNSNSSLASLFSRRREPYVVQTPLHEPALNVINALANLKHIAKGQYGEPALGRSAEEQRQSRGFEESMHYVLTYGSHADILQFLMQRDEICAALRYWQQQQLEVELFIQHIFQVSLAAGRLPLLVEELQHLDADAQLSAWRVPMLQTCRYLEQQQQLNSLYQLQLLLKDPIRASMTCVKFYPLHCDNFQKLHANAQHLVSAHMHLQGELDLAQWEHLQREQQKQVRRSSNVSCNAAGSTCFAMQLDARALNGHINTIRRQMELAKFLAHCEQEHSQPPVSGLPYTLQILKQIRLEVTRGTLPTLFDGAAEKVQLCILVLLCGKNIDEGFGLAYGIMQDYKLAPMKIFGASAKYLAKNQRLCEVDRLLDCIASNNGNGSSALDSDEVLSIAVNAAVHSHEPETKQALDKLVKRIGSVELRISSYIFIGQLKSAYLLANKHERLADIRKILRQAEMTNQIHIKKLCEKKLNINSTPISPTPL